MPHPLIFVATPFPLFPPVLAAPGKLKMFHPIFPSELPKIAPESQGSKSRVLRTV